jgi:DNA-binding NtrC family response regulator
MNILLVDDDLSSRKSTAHFLTNYLGHQVTECSNGNEALEFLEKEEFPMLLTDIRMPELNGIELLKKVKSDPRRETIYVVIITGYGELSTAIEALRNGAYDYLLKPVNVEELAAIVEKIAEHQHLLRENREFKTNFQAKLDESTKEIESQLKDLQSVYADIVGVGKVGIFSDKMKKIARLTEKYHKDRTIPVLIQGETGTGKEIIARMIHYNKGQVTAPFICINCSAISPSLFESELFGYEGGAFTGSKTKGMPGKLELAQGGTIFLDEIGDLPLDMQPKLLRVLQEREMYRIGGIKRIKLDVRVVCATNQDLRKLVDEGKFRRDLFYRLNTGFIDIPPLRERKEEIPPLAQLFLNHFAQIKKKRFRIISKKALDILMNKEWCGNIRDLENSIERAVLLYDEIELKPEHLEAGLYYEEEVAESQNTILIKLEDDSLPLEKIEKEIINKILHRFQGNKTRTAQYLGITRQTLRKKIQN